MKHRRHRGQRSGAQYMFVSAEAFAQELPCCVCRKGSVTQHTPADESTPKGNTHGSSLSAHVRPSGSTTRVQGY
jgi:hypothetical protein